MAGDHPLQFARYVLDPQGSIESSLLDHVPSMFAATGDLPDQKKPLLADALRELPNDVAKGAERFRSHVFGGVDPEPVEVGVGDPEAVHHRQAGQGRRRLAVLTGPLNPDLEGLHVEHVPLGILPVVVPVRDVPFPEEQFRALELSGPDRAIRPGAGHPAGVGWGERQRWSAVAVIEPGDRVRLAVPARIVEPASRAGIARRVAVRGVGENISGMVSDDIEDHVDPLLVSRPDQIPERRPRAEVRVHVEEILDPVPVIGRLEGELSKDRADPQGGDAQPAEVAEVCS